MAMVVVYLAGGCATRQLEITALMGLSFVSIYKI
jgi:hypothetical protein